LELWTLSLLAISLIGVGLGVLWCVRQRRHWFAQIETLSVESAAVRVELERHCDQMRFLCDFAQQFNGKMSLNEGIDYTIETLWQLQFVDSVAIVLGEDELGPFHYMGIRGIDNPIAIVGQECPLPLWGTLAHALVHRPEAGDLDCLIVDDIQAAGRPLPEEFPWLPGQGALLVIPLRGQDRTIGAAILHSGRKDAFRDGCQQRFLYTLVNYLSRALHETRIREQAQRWERQLVSLQLLTRTMTGVDSVESMLDVLCAESSDLFGAVAVHLFLQSAPTTRSPHLPLCHYSGPHLCKQEEQFVRSPDLARLLSWVMEAEQPLFVDPQAAIQSPDVLYYRENGHAVLVPIFGPQETANGVLLLVARGDARPFDENDLVVIRTIANSASVAIGNHRFNEVARPTPA